MQQSESGVVDFVSIPQFVKRSTLCRASVYNLIAAGELEKRRISRGRVALTRESVERWFASKLEAA